MTRQEKANELVDKFSNVALLDSYEAKLCALIAVDEIIEFCPNMDKFYWQEVKGKIEKL